jgi:hypothetical protein
MFLKENMTMKCKLFNTLVLASTGMIALSASAAQFPLSSDKLPLNERYKTFTHASGGPQVHAKDIAVVRPTGSNSWSDLKTDGADRTVNSNHLIYGKEIRAMVSGTVVGCWRNAPDNTKSGTKNADVLNFFTPIPGNHITIRTDDGVLALHAHAIPGTIPASICPNNAVKMTKASSATFPSEASVTGGVRITAGQFLGLAGNSGNSTGPHLHVHMQKDGVAVPMTFDRGMTTPNVNNAASYSGPWTRLGGKALPDGQILIWAPRSTGYWTVNNIRDEDFQGWFDHMADSGEMPENMPCSSDGQIYNGEWVPSKGGWYAHFGMTAAELSAKNTTYAAQGYSQYKWWFCGSLRSAIWRK